MRKREKTIKTINMSLKNLASAYPDGKLFSGRIEAVQADDGTTYYDLYNNQNELACMDGEDVDLIEVRRPVPLFVVLENNAGEKPVRFTLTPNEFCLATYFNDAEYHEEERTAIMEVMRLADYEISKETVNALLATGVVTVNRAADGRKAVWLVDDSHDMAIYTNNLSPLSEAEIDRLR